MKDHRPRSHLMSPHRLQMLALYLAGLTLLVLPYAVLGWMQWSAA